MMHEAAWFIVGALSMIFVLLCVTAWVEDADARRDYRQRHSENERARQEFEDDVRYFQEKKSPQQLHTDLWRESQIIDDRRN